jgi:hypothetical protein
MFSHGPSEATMRIARLEGRPARFPISARPLLIGLSLLAAAALGLSVLAHGGIDSWLKARIDPAAFDCY